MDSLDILLRLGYTRIAPKSDKIYHDAIKKGLEVFGQTSYEDLMAEICSKTGMTEIELIKNIHMFEEALKKLTGTVSAKIMMDVIKEELIKYTHLKTITPKIDQIIAKVEEYDVYDFIINTPFTAHILVLYKNQDTMDFITSDFFSKRTSAPFGLVSEFRTKIKDIRNMTYDVLSGQDKVDVVPIPNTFKIRSGPDVNVKSESAEIERDKKRTMKKLSDWIQNMHACNISGFPTRLADQDCTWYISNELGAEHLHLESSFGVKPYQQIIFLCGYDLLKIQTHDLTSLIKYHGYVILENESIELYQAPVKN